MPSSTVLVFPGQGAQAVGMGRDLAEALPEVKALFARADECLGRPLTKIIFEGPEEALVDTAVQQPALVLVSLAALKALELRSGGPLPALAAAGLSLGEYAALAAVGALSFEDALRLVQRRGELMKQASQAKPSGMAAVIKLDEAGVREACALAAKETEEVVAPCNFNGGGQIVIGGQTRALAKAGELIKARGGRALALKVAGAFHTEVMRPAVEGLRQALAGTKIQEARAPVYANVSASPVRTPAEIRQALEEQLTRPVLWERSIQNLKAAGAQRFLEVGSGKTLAGMIRKILPEAEVSSVGTWDEVQAWKG